MANDGKGSGRNRTLLMVVTIVLSVICAGLLAWFIYVVARPCRSSSCGKCDGSSKRAITSGTPPKVQGGANPPAPKFAPVTSAGDGVDNASGKTGGSSSGTQETMGARKTKPEPEPEPEPESEAVSEESEADLVRSLIPEGDVAKYEAAQGEVRERERSIRESWTSAMGVPGASEQEQAALDAIIAGERAGNRDTELLHATVPGEHSSRSAIPPRGSVASISLRPQGVPTASHARTANIVMTEEDQAKHDAAFDPERNMPKSYYMSSEENAARIEDENKLRRLAALYPERAAELLRNTQGTFMPTKEQSDQLRASHRTMRPQSIYVSNRLGGGERGGLLSKGRPAPRVTFTDDNRPMTISMDMEIARLHQQQQQTQQH